jgi:sarcosine oxidase delta subunit
LWKDTFKLEDNDKVNDLVYTSEHFQPYMKEAWAHGYKCTRFEDVLRI